MKRNKTQILADIKIMAASCPFPDDTGTAAVKISFPVPTAIEYATYCQIENKLVTRMEIFPSIHSDVDTTSRGNVPSRGQIKSCCGSYVVNFVSDANNRFLM